MSNLREKVAEGFRRGALRRTPQRAAVMEYLARHPVHATAEQVFRAVNRKDPKASRATVYNSLHALVQAGLVRQVSLEGKAARFDANVERHHHFICGGCGGIQDVERFPVPGLESHSSLKRFDILEYEVIFRGLCESCAAAKHRKKQV